MRRLGLHRRPGRPSCQSLWSLREPERNRALRPLCRASDDAASIQRRTTRVLDRGQLFCPSRSEGRPETQGSVPALELDPRAGPRQLAEPGRDLFLNRATKSPFTKRFPEPRCFSGATARFSILLGIRIQTIRMEIQSPRPGQTTRETGETRPRIAARQYETVFMKPCTKRTTAAISVSVVKRLLSLWTPVGAPLRLPDEHLRR